jgi:Nucleotide modification associated domain 2
VDLREQLRPGMSDIYFYKLTADNGGAPCVRHGLLSLAICKPMIRKTAEEGDLTFGFCRQLAASGQSMWRVSPKSSLMENTTGTADTSAGMIAFIDCRGRVTSGELRVSRAGVGES